MTGIPLFQVACQAYLYGLALGLAAFAGLLPAISGAAFFALFCRVLRSIRW
jgi:hypothetical protein